MSLPSALQVRTHAPWQRAKSAVGRWLDLVNCDVELVCFGASGGGRAISAARVCDTCAHRRDESRNGMDDERVQTPLSRRQWKPGWQRENNALPFVSDRCCTAKLLQAFQIDSSMHHAGQKQVQPALFPVSTTRQPPPELNFPANFLARAAIWKCGSAAQQMTWHGDIDRDFAPVFNR